MVKLLSGIKDKNLGGCGKFVLAGDMNEIAGTTEIDLSSMNTLEGDLKSFADLPLTSLVAKGCMNLGGNWRG